MVHAHERRRCVKVDWGEHQFHPRPAIAMRCWHEDAKRLSPEGVAARAEGIARTLFIIFYLS